MQVCNNWSDLATTVVMSAVIHIIAEIWTSRNSIESMKLSYHHVKNKSFAALNLRVVSAQVMCSQL